jgi:hypothetical protein
MRMTPLRISILCVLFVVACRTPGYAAEPAAVTLQIKPSLCITDRVTRACDMTLAIRWTSNSAGQYCLSNDLQTAPLRCWDEASLGELAERREVRDPLTYWMALPGGRERLAVAQVEVLRLDSGDRKRQRRSRHVWDIL